MNRGGERTEGPESAAGCTAPELGRRLGQYATGTLDPSAAERFEQHLLSCPACAEELETRIAVGEILAEQRRPIGRGGWIAIATAAVVIAAAAGLWLADQRPAEPRELTLTQVLRGAEAVETTAPGEALRLRLVVQVPADPGVRYTVVVRDPEGEEVEGFRGVAPSGPRTVTILLEQGVPRAGDYQIDVAEEGRGDVEPLVTRFVLRARGRR